MTLATGVVGLFVLLRQAEAEQARLAVARRNAEAYEKFRRKRGRRTRHYLSERQSALIPILNKWTGGAKTSTCHRRFKGTGGSSHPPTWASSR